MSQAPLKKLENLATFTSQSIPATTSWCREASAPFRQNTPSLSPCPHHALSWLLALSVLHVTCLDPVTVWVQDPEARELWRALPVPTLAWLSISLTAISTKIKAKILSSKSPWVYEHPKHKRSAHDQCWAQELFFSWIKKVCETAQPSKQVFLLTRATSSHMGITRVALRIFLFLLHFWEQAKIVLSHPLEVVLARKLWAQGTSVTSGP